MSKSDEGNRELSREEKLHMGNEIEKLKLSAFNDALFFSNNKIPAEIESEWLNYITQFEEQAGNVDQITVSERLGNPEFPSIEKLTLNEAEKMLDKVQKLMAENGLYLETIVEMPAAEIYRFIIEELFQHEIDDLKIEGLQTCFIYEEFHPNDGLDIEQTLDDFIRQTLSSDFRDYLDMHLAESILNSKEEFISKEKAVEKAIAFGDLYEHFTIEKLEDFDIKIDEEQMRSSVTFQLSFTAVSGDVSHCFEGTARATLHKGNLGYWNIVTLEFPGFNF
ncbi:MAG TPA: hypothetical protein VJ905_07750 [Halalkalibaculum sp.]|nr:hypothetical protein [Halalkalibaculum sp.]